MRERLRGKRKIKLDFDIASRQAGPKGTTSLRARRRPLADPGVQLRSLQRLDLSATPHQGSFQGCLREVGWERLSPSRIEIFQINMGKLCNMTCRHCHVDSGPDRTRENMDRGTVDACLEALDKTQAHTVDITGGAPELNPNFCYLVEESLRRRRRVIDRCNLTVLLLPRLNHLPQWLSDRGVEVVCSLPHPRRRNTDAQRGEGAFEKSIEALRRLNVSGYGSGDPERVLTLVANPVGAFLSGDQRAMEREWKESLGREFGVSFDRLITLNNMPISRFLEWLIESDNLEGYMELLVSSFNPATVAGLMCRNTVSVSWDGYIYDCDFNQMLELRSREPDGKRPTVFDFDPETFGKRGIVTGRHCFGCTAGKGSSCGGAIED